MFDQVIAFTLKEEGGYSVIRNDPGNWSSGVVGVGTFIGTNHGISAPVLISWASHRETVTAQFMEQLSVADATSIYRASYWNSILGDELPIGPSLMVFDFGVTSGVGESARVFQECLGLSVDDVDGHIGWGVTLPLATTKDQAALIGLLQSAQEAVYRRARNFNVFGSSWLKRLQRRAIASQNLVAGRPPTVGLTAPEAVQGQVTRPIYS